jgi:dienelactone hydrolase
MAEEMPMATPRLFKVRLDGSDGGPLHLDVRTGAQPGERRPAVVICHGFKGFKDWGMFPKLAERLARAGFTVITFNFSGSGVADGEEFTELERWRRQKPSGDLADLATVVDYAASQGPGAIHLIGHSRGGALAILQASRDSRISSLVTWAAIDHFLRFSDEEIRRWRETGQLDVLNTRTGQVLPIGLEALADVEAHGTGLLDVKGAAARIAQPWLLVHGTGDRSVPVETGRLLAATACATIPETLFIEAADHTFGAKHPWAGETADFREAVERTVGFFR